MVFMKKEKMIPIIGVAFAIKFVANISMMLVNGNSFSIMSIIGILVEGFWIACLIFNKNTKLFVASSALMGVYHFVNCWVANYGTLGEVTNVLTSILLACLILVVPFVGMVVYGLKQMGINKLEKLERFMMPLCVSNASVILLSFVVSSLMMYLSIGLGVSSKESFIGFIGSILISCFDCVGETLIVISLWISMQENTERVVDDKRYYPVLRHTVLSAFSFGIWNLIWIYKMTKATNGTGRFEYRYPIKALLCCMFVPFYHIYWVYSTTKRVESLLEQKRIFVNDSSINVAFAWFAPLVAQVNIQERMNQYIIAEEPEENSESVLSPKISC